MVNANKSSWLCWKYQDAEGTAIITGATDTTYEFGGYSEECDKWNSPFENNDISFYHKYAERNAFLVQNEKGFPTWKISYHPITAQFLGRIMKKPLTGAPITIDFLHSGKTYPLTIRFQEMEGTNPMLIQTVDNYSIGCYVRGLRGSDLLVEEEFAFGSLTDDDTALTTAPLNAGSSDTITLTNNYDGNPYVKWDYGDENVELDTVYMAEFKIDQVYKTVSTTNGTKQTVNCHEYKPINIILSAILDDVDLWDDYRDRRASVDLEIKFWKPDGTNYIDCIFTNCYVKSIVKTGIKYKGHYDSKIIINAEDLSCTSNFLSENDLSGADDFADHYVAGVA